MLRSHVTRVRCVGSFLSAAAIAAAFGCGGGEKASSTASSTAATGCDTTLTLPAGFCATVFADSLGHARHLAVAPNGDVYVNTVPGRGQNGPPPHPGGVIVALRDTNHSGHASVVARFGSDGTKPHTGGTGIAVYDGYVYAEDGSDVVRYKLQTGTLVPDSAREVVLSGMPIEKGHTMHPFIIDSSGTMYIDMGSATNSCQSKDRTLQAPGQKPCAELATRAGILEVRCQEGRTALFGQSTLRHRTPQHRGLRDQSCGRETVRDAAWS